MLRLRSTLKRIAGLMAIGALIWIVVAEPIDTGRLEGSEFQTVSLRALEQSLSALQPAHAGELMAGAARVEIAPPIEWEVPLGGNRQLRFARADGKRAESVWARALALRQGESAFVLVSADIMVVYPEMVEAVLARIRQEVDLARGQLMLVAAHTHGGPGGYWRGVLPEISIGPYQERLLDFLVERLAVAAIEAWRALEPAHLRWGSTSVELTVKNRVRLDGPENGDLGLLRFDLPTSGSTIDLVNYAAHPTNLLKGNRQLTGDYPALMAMLVETADAGKTVVFTPGTIGDQKSWYKREKRLDVKVRAIAEHLVEGIDGIDLHPEDAPILEAFEFEVLLPPFQPRLVRSDWFGSWAVRGWVADALFPEGMDRAVIQVARIGSTAIIGAPSDLATSVAQPLIAQAAELGLHVFFVSMAEDWIGYVMTEEEYEDQDYKVISQFHGPLSGPLFATVYERLIAELAGRASGGVG